ncbi:anti-sigma factor [Salinimonas chungwhensis]|uniref:anti-sigma factor n=1 Tax=Salinimonas chungwhensis TaxID=265425 RepID=UPI000360900E|nr:anti-sigma factor [Salinimonas chungwhensis]
MNYLNRERRHALAAEYVLGTLRGPARERFRKLMMRHEALARTTWYWERQLNSLTTSLPGQTPSEHVWQNIAGRTIDLDRTANVPASKASTKPGWWLWGGLAATFFIAALLLWTRLPSPQEVTPSQIAVVNNEQSAPLWLIEVVNDQLIVKATGNIENRNARDYELWVIPEDGTAPVSLGVIPQSGIWQRPLHPLIVKNAVKALAVSLEDKGGSRTGSPAEVLFTTTLASL